MLSLLDPDVSEEQLLEQVFNVERMSVPRHLVLGPGEAQDEFGLFARPNRAALDRMNVLLPSKSSRQPPTLGRQDDRLDPNQWILRRGALVVTHFGTVDWHRPAYHSPTSLFPVGYTSKRCFFDLLAPFNLTTYVCTIVRWPNEERPLFQVRRLPGAFEDLATADTQNVFEGSSPNEVWNSVYSALQAARVALRGAAPPRHRENWPDGNYMFGLSLPPVIKMLEQLQGIHLGAGGKKKDVPDCSSSLANCLVEYGLSRCWSLCQLRLCLWQAPASQ